VKLLCFLELSVWGSLVEFLGLEALELGADPMFILQSGEWSGERRRGKGEMAPGVWSFLHVCVTSLSLPSPFQGERIVRGTQRNSDEIK
jgi:hypothetical protein